MKRLLFALTTITLSLCANAEGYQINTLSAKQGGMGHTGVAQKLGAESMYFNPAGLGFMKKTLDMSASINGVAATCKALYEDQWYKTDNDISTPFMVNAAFKIYDNLSAGINFYTPYGSGINWGVNWPGALLSQSVSLKTFTVQPTVGWRVLPNLSIGAGFMISWGSVDLNKGLIVPSTMDAALSVLAPSAEKFGAIVPASVNLTGTSNLAFGVNVGAMYDINEKWTVGANFRTKQVIKVDAGLAKVTYANKTASSILENTLGLINEANFAAEMPLPSVLSVGVSYRPIKPLLLAFDAQFTGWSTYKNLDIDFGESLSSFNQHITKDYKNSWAFRLGAQYGVTKRCDLRAGFIVDLTPVNKSYYNPETPGMTKLEPSVGLSFRPIPSVSIDLSMLYVAGLGVDGATVPYTDMLASLYPNFNLPTVKYFTADYRLHAFVPSFGISYSF